MGARRRYAIEREPAQERPRAVLQRAPEQDASVLALQRSAGNRAVAAQLQVARDGTVPLDAETKRGATLSLDDLGAVEIDSFQWAAGSGGSKEDVHEIVVTARITKLGKLSATIQKAAVDGRKFDKADLAKGPTVIHLHDVYISGYQTSSGSDDAAVTFTLNFGSIDFDQSDKNKPAQGNPDSPSWDLGQATGV